MTIWGRFLFLVNPDIRKKVERYISLSKQFSDWHSSADGDLDAICTNSTKICVELVKLHVFTSAERKLDRHGRIRC